MKQYIKAFFTFNKRERNGVFILAVIIAAQLLYLQIAPLLVSPAPQNFSEFEKYIAMIDDSIKEEKQQRSDFFRSASGSISIKNKDAKVAFERFDFDPNQLPEKGWKRLGLTDKQIRTIKNFQSKGGKFKTKEDVKKMYCIKEEQYKSLAPYIVIPTATAIFENGEVKSTKAEEKASAVMIELNTVDSAQLTTIKGIGPFYAKSIIKYRSLLGGFVAKEQLMEIWKFDEEKYRRIENFVVVNSSLAKKIKLNSCEPGDLIGPYIKWNVANAIVNYRKAHGKFKTIDDIKQTDLVDDETLRKIAPYLIVD